MARWAPGAAGRLQEAALDLYVAQGYEQTTVAEIAERAGVTARTYFRHYADKREVLFAGSSVVEDGMVAAVLEAPADLQPLEALGEALAWAGDLFGRDHDHSSRRQRVITENPELLERELAKMARLAAALSGALVRRGVPSEQARLVAELGIAVFRVGFDRWAAGDGRGSLADSLRDALEELRGLVG